MTTLSAIPESTYQDSYRGTVSTQPFIRFRTLPFIQRPQQLPDRHAKTIKENRLVTMNYRATSAKKGRPKSAEKRPVKPVKVLNTKFGPMDMTEITRLYNKTRYDTFAQRAGREYMLLPMHRPEPPKHTKEEKPDMIKLKGRKYEDCREEWQDAALWDRIQTRVPTKRPETPVRKKQLLRRQKSVQLNPEVEAEIYSLVKTDGLANVFVMKCPSYAGYAPMCPPETRLNDKRKEVITTTMKSSYRYYPKREYKPQFYGHKGPLSKTVTLTFPYNPFNKIGEDVGPGNKEKIDHHEQLIGGPEPSYLY